MNQIFIISESPAVGKHLRELLYQAGYPDTTVSNWAALPETAQNNLLIVYAKTRISDIILNAADSSFRVILLLNPDCYARYLDRARHAGIRLLLMPVSPCMLLDAVQEAAVIS